ncbi:MAG: glycosyltransferase [Bacteroidota bacterium]
MVLGIIVTYNPSIVDIEKNILAIKPQLDRLIVFDNASENVQELNKLCNKLNVEFIKSNRNVGLGAAYNFVISNNNNFDYLATFDQDTFLEVNTIKQLLSLFTINLSVGIVGPSFFKKRIMSKNEYIEVDYLIQSCSIFSKIVIDKVGLFNENLFIDSVDFEYCLRTLKLKFKIIKSTTILIEHNLGIQNKKFGINFIQHNALRNYYIARNHKFLTIKYIKHFPYFILRKNFFFIIHIFKLIFLDQDLKKIKSLVKGLKDNVD